MARNRYKDALGIDAGACNPIAVTNSLKEHLAAFQKADDYTGFDQMRADPALRLIVHQLAHLFGSNMSLTEYMRIKRIVEQQVADEKELGL